MEQNDAAPQASGNLKKYLPLAVLGLMIVLVFSMGWHKYLSLSQIAEHREALRGFVDGNSSWRLPPIWRSISWWWPCRCPAARC